MADTPQNQPATDGKPMSEEQRKHHDELYNYKRDEEGTLDTSAQLDAETVGIPLGSPNTGPDPETPLPDETMLPSINNPIDDNNR